MPLTTPAKFKGKDAFYERMVKLLVVDFPEAWASFDDFMKDPESAKTFVHKIKGAAGNLDLTAVFQSAADFELSIRNGAPDGDKYALFIKACDDLKKELA